MSEPERFNKTYASCYQVYNNLNVILYVRFFFATSWWLIIAIICTTTNTITVDVVGNVLITVLKYLGNTNVYVLFKKNILGNNIDLFKNKIYVTIEESKFQNVLWMFLTTLFKFPWQKNEFSPVICILCAYIKE